MTEYNLHGPYFIGKLLEWLDPLSYGKIKQINGKGSFLRGLAPLLFHFAEQSNGGACPPINLDPLLRAVGAANMPEP